MSIAIFYDNVGFRLKETGRVKRFINKVIRGKGKVPGDLNFIFTGDEALLEINKEFLQHDSFTDVLTFNYNDGKIVTGEIYISIESVRRNAFRYKSSLRQEVLRVMLHGILHLCGYNDLTASEREEMKNEEERNLKSYTKA